MSSFVFLVLSNLVWSCLFYPMLSSSVLFSALVLSCLVTSRLVLSCPGLCCLVLSCLVLSCVVPKENSELAGRKPNHNTDWTAILTEHIQNIIDLKTHFLWILGPWVILGPAWDPSSTAMTFWFQPCHSKPKTMPTQTHTHTHTLLLNDRKLLVFWRSVTANCFVKQQSSKGKLLRAAETSQSDTVCYEYPPSLFGNPFRPRGCEDPPMGICYNWAYATIEPKASNFRIFNIAFAKICIAYGISVLLSFVFCAFRCAPLLH